MRYRFEVVHVPGVKHKGADATSRHPTGDGDHLEVANLTLASLGTESPTEQSEPDRLSKVFLQGLRSKPTELEQENCLDREQQTLGLAMAMLAGLNFDEAGTDIEHHLRKLNTSTQYLYIRTTTNLCPI